MVEMLLLSSSSTSSILECDRKCVVLSCSKLDNSFVPKSYQIGSWKWLRNTMAKSPNVMYFTISSYMYHLAVPLMRVCWKRHK